MKFLVEVVSHKISTWNGILIIVQVNRYLGFKCTFRAQIASSKIRFQNQMNNREDPDPVRKGTGSSDLYTEYVYRENRNSLPVVYYENMTHTLRLRQSALLSRHVKDEEDDSTAPVSVLDIQVNAVRRTTGTLSMKYHCNGIFSWLCCIS
jgi:hypothetical protein